VTQQRWTLGDRFGRVVNRLAAPLDRFLTRGQRVLAEIPILFSTPAAMAQATLDGYDRKRQYLEPSDQTSGFRQFEERMLARFFPPPPANLLTHGVGAGREVLALARAGYRIEAYEPAPALAAAAEQLVSGTVPGAGPVRTLSLQEWAANPSGTFGGVFTGWGVWAHILRQQDRLAILEAFRRVCPEGPVLLSFLRGGRFFDVQEKPSGRVPLYPPTWDDRVQRFTRQRLRQRLLRAPPIERGTTWMDGMYFHQTEEWELVDESAQAGYEVAYFEPDARRQPHAVLLPRR
jgi:hypothetical protein